MNLGKRIQQRLNDLGWKQRDLLDKVPDLSPQALSNMIRRDSSRSDWDEAIAEALGVSILWLVYGKKDKADVVRQEIQPYGDAAFIISVFNKVDSIGKAAFLGLAKGLHEEYLSKKRELSNKQRNLLVGS
jgi:hypothetical protein